MHFYQHSQSHKITMVSRACARDGEHENGGKLNFESVAETSTAPEPRLESTPEGQQHHTLQHCHPAIETQTHRQTTTCQIPRHITPQYLTSAIEPSPSPTTPPITSRSLYLPRAPSTIFTLPLLSPSISDSSSSSGSLYRDQALKMHNSVRCASQNIRNPVPGNLPRLGKYGWKNLERTRKVFPGVWAWLVGVVEVGGQGEGKGSMEDEDGHVRQEDWIWEDQGGEENQDSGNEEWEQVWVWEDASAEANQNNTNKQGQVSHTEPCGDTWAFKDNNSDVNDKYDGRMEKSV